MDITRITTQAQFDELAGWATLNVYTFGSLIDLPRVEADEDVEADVYIAAIVKDGKAVAYISANQHGVWCVETHPDHRRHGYAKALVKASEARHFCEVISATCRDLAEACGCSFELSEDFVA